MPVDVRGLDAGERDQAIFTALERPQGVEKEQRFVWSPFFAPSPDVDGGEAVEEVLVAGLVGLGCQGSIMAVLGWWGCLRQGSRTGGGRRQVMPWFSEGVWAI